MTEEAREYDGKLTTAAFMDVLHKHNMILRKDDASGEMPYIEYVPHKRIVISSCHNAYCVWMERCELPKTYGETYFILKAAAAWNRREYHT